MTNKFHKYEGKPAKNNKHGIALITVLYVMVILFILSMGVLELINTNIGLSANIPARIQALNLANAGVMLGMDDLKKIHDADPSHIPSPNFITPYKPSNYNLPGKCTISYYDNLKDGDDKTVNSSDIPSLFSPYIKTNMTVPQKSAIILSQGEYKGFKRTIKVQVKFTIYGTGTDEKIKLSDGPFMLAGMTGNSLNPLISVIGSSTVFFGKNGIEYKDLTGAKFYDSSQLYTSTSASVTKTGGGIDIPEKYAIAKNPSDLPELPTWTIWDYLPSSYVTSFGDMGDPNLAISLPDPNNSDSYYDPNNPTPYKTIEQSDPYNQIRIEPCAPVTGPDEPTNTIFTDNHKLNPNQTYYYHRGTLAEPTYGTVYVTQDTFINGNLHLNQGLTLGKDGNTPVDLFVNGSLIVDGIVYGYGNIFVSKHFIASSPDPNIAVDLKTVRFRSPGWGRDNVRIFAEGDIRLGTPKKDDAFSFPIPTGGCNETHINTGLADMPIDAKLLEDTFKKLGLTDTIDYTWSPPDNTTVKSFTIAEWFKSDTGDRKFDGTALARSPGFTGEEILQGKAPDIAIPAEVAAWFNTAHGGCTFLWACYISMPDHANWNTRWEAFTAHPNFFQSCYDVFFSGTLYSHGNITTENAHVPIRIVGGTVATGDITLTQGSSIIIYPLYFEPEKGPPLITPVILVYTWEEL